MIETWRWHHLVVVNYHDRLYTVSEVEDDSTLHSFSTMERAVEDFKRRLHAA